MGINCSSEIHCVDTGSLLCALIVKVHVNKRVAMKRVKKIVFKIIFSKEKEIAGQIPPLKKKLRSRSVARIFATNRLLI